MFYQIRYQTGEIEEVVTQMKKGNIPCMDVDDTKEFNWVINELAQKGMQRILDAPPDRNAKDTLKEPEFEFRIAFSNISNAKDTSIYYIDFYFEPFEEEDYAGVFAD
ncbi:MAG: hypothetical protein GX992_08360 [Clostridium sp.]|nr:hypothetical protein [Clostridium sp.]